MGQEPQWVLDPLHHFPCRAGQGYYLYSIPSIHAQWCFAGEEMNGHPSQCRPGARAVERPDVLGSPTSTTLFPKRFEPCCALRQRVVQGFKNLRRYLLLHLAQALFPKAQEGVRLVLIFPHRQNFLAELFSKQRRVWQNDSANKGLRRFAELPRDRVPAECVGILRRGRLT